MALQHAITVLLLTTSFSAFAAEVSGLRVWTDPDKTRVVLDLDQKVDYSLFTLEQPSRVVIDIKSAEFKTSAELQSEYAGVINGVRLGQSKDGTLRVVFDLGAEVSLKSFLLAPTAQYGHRLVLDMFPPQAANREPSRPVQSLQSQDREVVVAIDAGHGGEDPGAIGRNRTREKDVVLQISRRLQDVINAEPGMRAVLTRDGDYYIPLRTRYEKARQHRADLFVSIHADAFKNSNVRGSSVFVLSQRGASSEFARLVADAENASDLIGGVSLADKDDVLASVLLDLSQSATIQASDKVAADILSSLNRSVKVHKPVIGRANFMVLKSPDLPSVLVETAFISNPDEEKKLTERQFQEDMAAAIGRGVRNYFYNSPPPGTWIAAHRGNNTRHVVSRGETLGGIATQYNISLSSLRQANNINGDVLHVGKELLIPTS